MTLENRRSTAQVIEEEEAFRVSWGSSQSCSTGQWHFPLISSTVLFLSLSFGGPCKECPSPVPVSIYSIRYIHSRNMDPRCHPFTRNPLFFFGEELLILFSTQQPNDHFTVCVHQTKSCFLVRVKNKIAPRIFSCHGPSDIIFCRLALSSFQPPWPPCHFTNTTSILLPRSLVLAVLSARMPVSQVSSQSALSLLWVFFFFSSVVSPWVLSWSQCLAGFPFPTSVSLSCFCCIFLHKNVSPLDSHVVLNVSFFVCLHQQKFKLHENRDFCLLLLLLCHWYLELSQTKSRWSIHFYWASKYIKCNFKIHFNIYNKNLPKLLFPLLNHFLIIFLCVLFQVKFQIISSNSASKNAIWIFIAVTI